ncbi:hypothetical protein B0H16DRAFT_1480845 [Mycena metata]|uniref:Uncharacterized protein n=1 Tax=Mycena metata TaxID=1033252 RepID=A0AAD7H219_9AGAR|nr:hypothetical protein B0H16DRAFT_1480845 [Mycena metata]
MMVGRVPVLTGGHSAETKRETATVEAGREGRGDRPASATPFGELLGVPPTDYSVNATDGYQPSLVGFTSMSTDIQKGERDTSTLTGRALLSALNSFSMDSSFCVKEISGGTLTSDDIEDDDIMPVLIAIEDDECCPFLQPRVKSKL